MSCCSKSRDHRRWRRWAVVAILPIRITRHYYHHQNHRLWWCHCGAYNVIVRIIGYGITIWYPKAVVLVRIIIIIIRQRAMAIVVVIHHKNKNDKVLYLWTSKDAQWYIYSYTVLDPTKRLLWVCLTSWSYNVPNDTFCLWVHRTWIGTLDLRKFEAGNFQRWHSRVEYTTKKVYKAKQDFPTIVHK